MLRERATGPRSSCRLHRCVKIWNSVSQVYIQHPVHFYYTTLALWFCIRYIPILTSRLVLSWNWVRQSLQVTELRDEEATKLCGPHDLLCQSAVLRWYWGCFPVSKSNLVVCYVTEAQLVSTRSLSFKVTCPMQWNSLPVEIQQTSSLLTFRRLSGDLSLKTELGGYYYSMSAHHCHLLPIISHSAKTSGSSCSALTTTLNANWKNCVPALYFTGWHMDK